MKTYRESLAAQYRLIFDDRDKVLLFLVAAASGGVCGFVVKNHFEVVGGSVFLIGGAVVAGVLSYLAIESNREMKEKELERKDLEEYGSACFDLTIDIHESKLSAQQMVYALDSRQKTQETLFKTRTEIIKVKKDLSDLGEENVDNFEEVRDKEDRLRDLETRHEKISSAMNDHDEAVGDNLEDLNEKFNGVAKAENKIKLLYYRISNSHKLDGVDLYGLKDHLDDCSEQFKAAKELFYKSIILRINKKGLDDEGCKELEGKQLDYYGFPEPVDTYPEIQKAYKCPGLSASKNTDKYLLVFNRCIAVSLFFIAITVINGFSFK